MAPESTRPTLLPEPDPREVLYTFISADDHLVEPPDMFEGRLSSKYQDRAPKVIEDENGDQAWEFEGVRYHAVGYDAAAGRPIEEVKGSPCRYEHMRPAVWNVDERVRDMDINGTWASLSFPSLMTGFAGSRFAEAKDQDLGLAATRAWNDWLYEGWYSPYPDRCIPLGLTWLTDPEIGAEEIRRNAKRGFKAVTLPERPHLMGLPSVFSGYWDPIAKACADTGTVINLHVGSVRGTDRAEDMGDVALGVGSSLFGSAALSSCAEWLWAGFAVRYPDLQLCMAEGGIGWVAMLIDRLDNIMDRSGYGRSFPDPKLRPAEVLRRNFNFTTIDDPATIVTRGTIGVENIMLESDYPHADGTWPNTQAVIHKYYGDLPEEEVRLMTHANAAKLYRHPLPEKGPLTPR